MRGSNSKLLFFWKNGVMLSDIWKQIYHLFKKKSHKSRISSFLKAGMSPKNFFNVILNSFVKSLIFHWEFITYSVHIVTRKQYCSLWATNDYFFCTMWNALLLLKPLPWLLAIFLSAFVIRLSSVSFPFTEWMTVFSFML